MSKALIPVIGNISSSSNGSQLMFRVHVFLTTSQGVNEIDINVTTQSTDTPTQMRTAFFNAVQSAAAGIGVTINTGDLIFPNFIVL